VSLVDVGVVALPLSLGGGGPVALVGQLDRANWQGVARDAGERTLVRGHSLLVPPIDPFAA